jgi:DNA-binding MarR family transcriptional regulator
MRITAYLEKSPIYQTHRSARVLAAQMGGILSDASGPLSFLEALVLVAVFFEHPNPAQPSQLAETFSTTRGNISHCISGLEAKGLLRRRIDEKDSRAYQLALKPHGRKRAMELIRVLDRLQRHLERNIGAQQIDSALTVMHEVERVCESEPRAK